MHPCLRWLACVGDPRDALPGDSAGEAAYSSSHDAIVAAAAAAAASPLRYLHAMPKLTITPGTTCSILARVFDRCFQVMSAPCSELCNATRNLLLTTVHACH